MEEITLLNRKNEQFILFLISAIFTEFCHAHFYSHWFLYCASTKEYRFLNETISRYANAASRSGRGCIELNKLSTTRYLFCFFLFFLVTYLPVTWSHFIRWVYSLLVTIWDSHFLSALRTALRKDPCSERVGIDEVAAEPILDVVAPLFPHCPPCRFLPGTIPSTIVRSSPSLVENNESRPVPWDRPGSRSLHWWYEWCSWLWAYADRRSFQSSLAFPMIESRLRFQKSFVTGEGESLNQTTFQSWWCSSSWRMLVVRAWRMPSSTETQIPHCCFSQYETDSRW